MSDKASRKPTERRVMRMIGGNKKWAPPPTPTLENETGDYFYCVTTNELLRWADHQAVTVLIREDVPKEDARRLLQAMIDALDWTYQNYIEGVSPDGTGSWFNVPDLGEAWNEEDK